MVSGIGFLGGGVILRDGLTVRGLTAATTLWCSTAVGTLAGSGFLGPALVAASVVVGANVLLRPWGHWIGARSRDTSEGQFVYHLEVCGPIHHEQQLQSVVLRALGGASHLTLRGVSSDRSASDSVRL